MNNPIELITNTGSIWKFEDPALLTKEFVSGFLYGGMFLLKQLPVESDPYFTIRNTFFDTALKKYDVPPIRIHSVSQLHNFANFRSAELDKVQANVKKYMNVPGKYAVMLHDPRYEDVFDLFYVESLVFFQGLFTALNIGNIPYETVILHKPIKDGVAYNIQGLNLPNLEDIQ